MIQGTFLTPNTIDEAVKFFSSSEGSVKLLAGGTDLLVQIRNGFTKPDKIIDIKNIRELQEIIDNGNGSFTVGAAVSGASLAEHNKFGKNWPGVLEALRLIGSEQIQGRASLGGNLCNASPAGDSVPALIASGALAKVHGPNGIRSIPVEKINLGPGKTNLQKGEIVTQFDFPDREPSSSDSYLRMIPRTEMDIAVVGCAVNISMDGDKCIDARIALGAVAPTALLVDQAAKIIIGSKLEDDVLNEAAKACQNACKPIDDKRGTITYRKKVSGVLFKRAIQIAKERALKV